MIDLYALDDLADLDDGQALRRRLDERNQRILPFVLMLLVPACFGLMAAAIDQQAPVASVLMGLDLLGAALLLGPVRRLVDSGRRPRLPWTAPLTLRLRDRFAHFLPLFALLEGAAFVAWTVLTAAQPALYFIYPCLLLAFRFAPSELGAVHGGVMALCVGALWASHAETGLVIGVVVVHLCLFAIALVANVRFRRRFLSQWRRAASRAREQLRMRRELEAARDMQLSMLPRESPALPWLEIASMSLPATEVGGDYFDFFPHGGERLVVAVGDVAGHGLASGMVLSGVRSCLALLMEDDEDLPRVLERLDGMIRRTAPHRMLVTLSLLELGRGGATATLTSAGHPPLLLRHGDGSVESVGTPALPLGTRIARGHHQRSWRSRPATCSCSAPTACIEARDRAARPTAAIGSPPRSPPRTPPPAPWRLATASCTTSGRSAATPRRATTSHWSCCGCATTSLPSAGSEPPAARRWGGRGAGAAKHHNQPVGSQDPSAGVGSTRSALRYKEPVNITTGDHDDRQVPFRRLRPPSRAGARLLAEQKRPGRSADGGEPDRAERHAAGRHCSRAHPT